MTTLTATLSVTLDGVDITDDILFLSRSNNICTGVGLISFRVYGGGSVNPTTWEEIILHENGIKKGTYYVSDFTSDATTGELTINGQDNSKRLVDWFISEQVITGGTTFARTWIEFFLTEAGVSFSFTTAEQGNIVPPDSTFGFSSAFDTIQSLLQQSGWYMYFNANGSAVIGKLDVELENPKANIKENKITNIYTNRSDKMLRNRAVVWGQADTVNGGWVFADVSTQTPWNYDAQDKRAVVFSNPYIQTFGTAYELAYMLLNEFARLNYEKTVQTVGFYNVSIGDVVMINSRIFSGMGLVTGLLMEYSPDGVTTTLELDRRCPRLFGYFSYDLNYVYAATWGSGIWRKLIESTTWADFSTGLESLYVKDLFVLNGSFVCVTDDGFAYYKNSIYSNWTKFEHGILKDSFGTEYPQEATRAESCTINGLGEIIVTYNYYDENQPRSWIIVLNADGTFLRAEYIKLAGEDKYTAFDIEAYTQEQNIISLQGLGGSDPAIGNEKRTIQVGKLGRIGYGRDSNDYVRAMDINDFIDGVFADLTLAFGTVRSSIVVDENKHAWCFSNVAVLEGDLNTLTETEHDFTTPSPFPTTQIDWFVHRTSDTNINLVGVHVDLGSLTLRIIHYRWIGTTTLSNIGITTINNDIGGTGQYWGSVVHDKYVYIHHRDDAGNGKMTVYDMVLGTESTSNYASGAPGGDDPGDTFMGIEPNGTAWFGWIYRETNSSPTPDRLMMNYVSGSNGTINVPSQPLELTTGDNLAAVIAVFSHIGTQSRIGSTSLSSYLRVDTARDFGSTAQMLAVYVAFPALTVSVKESSTFAKTTGFYDASSEYIVWYSGGFAADPSGWIQDNKNFGPYSIHRRQENLGSGDFYYNFIQMGTGAWIGSRKQGVNSEISGLGVQDLQFLKQGDDFDGSLLAIGARTVSGTKVLLLGFSDGGVVQKELRSFQAIATTGGNMFANYFVNVSTNIQFYELNPTTVATAAGVIATHNSEPAEESASVNAENPTTAQLVNIYEPEKICKVEISKVSPTVIYSPPPSGIYYYDLTAQEKESFVAVSFTNTAGSFILPPTLAGATVFDARVFDYPVNEQLYVEDGPLTGLDPQRYIALATGDAIKILNVTLDGTLGSNYNSLLTYGTLSTENTITLSGANDPLINHLETTNYILYPWFFVPVSGVIADDIFWQRGETQTSFSRYTLNFPLADVTIVRTDDFV